ncbi:hypothetical protein MLD38_024499 [Melastoma candidum]|uniref:Uncharacterized protein n=1 Tax=Melastoma candidum TaxID=119954 RepID=A0ACB9NTU0_9MYRT|nr:hypothetical protein MLD38_024499 [Melastoma candidum]
MKKVVVLRKYARGSSDEDLPNRPSSRPHSSNVNDNNVRWGACQKNQAVSTGGHSLDGCIQFVPGSGYACASCGCHRNFHKKEES